MGRKGKVDTRRKPILQLDQNRKSAKSNKKNSNKGENTAKPKYQPLYVDGGAGEVFDPQEQEKVAAEIESFLKEIVEASKQEKENYYQGESQESFASESMDASAVVSSLPQAEAPPDTTISFWQAIVDPKTNRSYYWNPTTNEVSWTLPPNSVITSEQPVPPVSGAGEASTTPNVATSLQDYYAYYSQQLYGADTTAPSQSAVLEVPKDVNNQVQSTVSSAPGSASSDVTTSEPAAGAPTSDSSVLDSTQEEFIGPTFVPPANRIKGMASAQQDLVHGEKRAAEEAQSPSSVTDGAEKASKRAKLQGDKTPVGAAKSKATGTPLSGSGSASEQVLRVSAMADELMRKLQYLHVGDEGLSELQVIKIQVETRLEDWKDGSLPSKHLLAKLKEANKCITEYESSAAPSGWKCVWDSATCRYFYQNVSTGESSWEYPSQAVQSPAHSELSEQQLLPVHEDQGEANESMDLVHQSSSANKETPHQDLDVTKSVSLKESEPQMSIESSSVAGPLPPPPPPLSQPPPSVHYSQSYPAPPPCPSVIAPLLQPTCSFETSQGFDSVQSSVLVPVSSPLQVGVQLLTADQPQVKDSLKSGLKPAMKPRVDDKDLTAEEVRQKLQRPLKSSGQYEPQDYPPCEESGSARSQVAASVGMEFISEFPPKQSEPVVISEQRKKSKDKKGKKQDKVEVVEQVTTQSESDTAHESRGYEISAPPRTVTTSPQTVTTSPQTVTTSNRQMTLHMQEEVEPTAKEPDVSCTLQEETVTTATTEEQLECIQKEYDSMLEKPPKPVATGPPYGNQQCWDQGENGNQQCWDQGENGNQQCWDQGENGNVTAPALQQEVNGDGGADDELEAIAFTTEQMLQPAGDEFGYEGSVEVETMEMCVSTSPSESFLPGTQDQVSTTAATEPSVVTNEATNVDTTVVSGRNLEESELMLRERLLRRVKAQTLPPTAAAQQSHEDAAEEVSGNILVADSDLDMSTKAPDVGESVELTGYGPDSGLLQGTDEPKYADQSQVGLQLEVSSTTPVRDQHALSTMKERREEGLRCEGQLVEEGEIVCTPEKRQHEVPLKASLEGGKVVKRDGGEKEESKSKSSKHSKRHRSRSRSKSRERHSRRSRKHSDASDSGDEYPRRSSRRGRKHRDDYSDSDDYHHSRRSRRHSDSEGERSSRKDRRHSRSASKDSKDSRDRSQKRKKKDKKDKKKRRSHRSASKERSGDDADKRKNSVSSSSQNIIVGKVGSVGSIRQLGQEKKTQQANAPLLDQTQLNQQQQQQPQDAMGQAVYYPQTYMYGSYQYPYGAVQEQSWQSSQGWDQHQQGGWQNQGAPASEQQQAWSAPSATITDQQEWEKAGHVSQLAQEECLSAAADVIQEQQQQQEEKKEELTKTVEELVDRCEGQPSGPVVEVMSSTTVDIQQSDGQPPVSHLYSGEEQEVVVEEAVIEETTEIVEIPAEAEITECDMEIEQVSSEAFAERKPLKPLVAEQEAVKEFPPGAETPPATERDRTPPPLKEPSTAGSQQIAYGATAIAAEDKFLLSDKDVIIAQSSASPKAREPPANVSSVQPALAKVSVETSESGEDKGPDVPPEPITLNGEKGRETPPTNDSAKREGSTPGTPTTTDPPVTSTVAATGTPQMYNYGPYAQQVAGAAGAGYDYSAYSQAGYDYSQAYSAYVQAAAASMAYASYSQYYANPYAAAFAGFGSPYAAYYSYANAGAFQSPTQTSTQTQQTDSGKKKKEESKGMIEKWNNLQTQYGKPT